MYKYSLLALFALTVVAAGCKTEATRAGGPAARPVGVAHAKPHNGVPRAGSGSYDVITLSVKPRGGAGAQGGAAGRRGGGGREAPMGRMGGHGGGCPQEMTGGMLGITFSQPHGCIVGHVAKEGPAGKAGLQSGDSIVKCNGAEVTCPASLLTALTKGGKGEVTELVVRRPKQGPGPSQAGARGQGTATAGQGAGGKAKAGGPAAKSPK